MNPATDSGKKPLPQNLMEKFTAINLPEPLRMDIEMMVSEIAPQLNASEIADIYFEVKKHQTVSLRNLSRCLSYLNRNKEIYGFKRALYDALLLGFQKK
jgi:midasin (ATPase involved in ribosome maturation)